MMHLEFWADLDPDGVHVNFGMKYDINGVSQPLQTAQWNTDMPYERITERTGNATRVMCNELDRLVKAVRRKQST
jgi:YD repeat-containing protein